MNHSTETRITAVSTVGIPVTDQDRALDFYFGTLGLEKRMDALVPQLGGRWIVVAPPGSQTTLALVPEREDAPSGVETGIRLATDDAEAPHKTLRSGGFEVGELLRWEGVPPMFALCDPDGNGLEVVEGYARGGVARRSSGAAGGHPRTSCGSTPDRPQCYDSTRRSTRKGRFRWPSQIFSSARRERSASAWRSSTRWWRSATVCAPPSKPLRPRAQRGLRVGPAGSAGAPPRLAGPDAGSDGPSSWNYCSLTLACGPQKRHDAWPSIPPRCIRLRGGSKRRERSSGETARSTRAVRRCSAHSARSLRASCGDLETVMGLMVYRGFESLPLPRVGKALDRGRFPLAASTTTARMR